MCREVVRQLGDAIPAGVEIKVLGSGRHCVLSSTGGPRPPRTLRPGDAEYNRDRRKLGSDASPEGQDIHEVTLGSWSGAWAPWGFGAWIPFLPRKLAARLAMIDVVESVQSVVANSLDRPWPGEGFKVRAKCKGDSVRLWLEDSSGADIRAVTLGLDLASA